MNTTLIGRCEDCGGKIYGHPTPWTEQNLSMLSKDKLLEIIHKQRLILDAQSRRSEMHMEIINELRSELATRRTEALAQPTCKQCGQQFHRIRSTKHFCSAKCRVSYHRTQTV